MYKYVNGPTLKRRRYGPLENDNNYDSLLWSYLEMILDSMLK